MRGEEAIDMDKDDPKMPAWSPDSDEIWWQLTDLARAKLIEQFRKGISDQAPVFNHRFDGESGLVVSLSDAALAAARTVVNVVVPQYVPCKGCTNMFENPGTYWWDFQHSPGCYFLGKKINLATANQLALERREARGMQPSEIGSAYLKPDLNPLPE